MARIRSIKPEFWTSEQVMECSPTTRLLFIGLWNFCDDAGRHPFSPKTIKAEIMPGDDVAADDILRMVAELERIGLIKTYDVDGKQYFYVTGWHHQKIDKPQKPKYPAPLAEHSPNDPRTFGVGYDTIRYDTIPPLPPEGVGAPAANVPRETSPSPVMQIIAAFDDARVERWGASQRRPWIDQTDRQEAADWIAEGADVELCREVFKREIETWRGKDLPKTLRAFKREIGAAIVARRAPAEERLDADAIALIRTRIQQLLEAGYTDAEVTAMSIRTMTDAEVTAKVAEKAMGWTADDLKAAE